MAFKTKEEILEDILLHDKPKCPYCGKEMSLWEVPPIPVGEGLGWGTPYLFICFNDECSLYVKGWANMEEGYGQTCSFRCLNYPGTAQFEIMPVFSATGGKGQIIDNQVLARQKALKEAIKKGLSILENCHVTKDWRTVLKMLLDANEPVRVRIQAAEIIGDIGGLDVIEPLRSQKFGYKLLIKKVEDAIKRIHKRHFTRECPFCAEIIKKRAKICRYCGKKVIEE